MSNHPDYIQFRREMFVGIGLPVNSHVDKDWRKMPMGRWSRHTVYKMQTLEEIDRLPTIMEYPIEQTLFTVPNWAWCPKWAWHFIPSHVELWHHIHKDVLAKQREMEQYHREQEDNAVAAYRRKQDKMRVAFDEELRKRQKQSQQFWDTIDS